MSTLDSVSVIVPENPFSPPELAHVHHCLCALNIEKLMRWWPGVPHAPHRDPAKVKAIQRSLDWKKVLEIAAYLLQAEITDSSQILDEVFGPIYEPKSNEPGREWPPKIRGSIKFQRSSFPSFSNVLIHVNGARVKKGSKKGAADLILSPTRNDFRLTVIDGQHRVNGGYLALRIMQKRKKGAFWQIPAEVFVNLDPVGEPPMRQAQIFIDVNLYQKRVDRSLVADLFPLARGDREPIEAKDRAQDIGRKLMLETGPLVGMIQIPGIRYGVKDVVALATLNGAIESILADLDGCDITNLEGQTAFIAEILDCWLAASGRAETVGAVELDSQNVAYQGRVLVSMLDLIPAILKKLKQKSVPFVSDGAREIAESFLRRIIERADLSHDGVFISKDKFKELGFLGSGGIGRFRDRLWAATNRKEKLGAASDSSIAKMAKAARGNVAKYLAQDAV